MSLILIVLVSIFIASISIIGGLGGGVLLIPILTVFFGLPLKTVIGSVLISLAVPTFIGAIGAWRRKEIDLKLAVIFETPTAIGAYFGAKLTASLDERIIVIVFSAIALFLSTKMIKRALDDRKEIEPSISPFWKNVGSIPPVIHLKKNGHSYDISIPSLIIFGFIIGTISGMLGLGGGWIKTPLLIGGFGVPPTISTGTAIFMILITAIVGGTTHLLEGNSDPYLVLALGLGLGIGAIIANALKPRLKAYQITLTLGITLLLISIIFIIPVIIG